jgi:DNA replication protein DnaC
VNDVRVRKTAFKRRLRYENASAILTSNRPLDDWPKLFGVASAVAAFLDRLMHHSHLIELRGKSYRLQRALPRRTKQEGEGDGPNYCCPRPHD